MTATDGNDYFRLCSSNQRVYGGLLVDLLFDKPVEVPDDALDCEAEGADAAEIVAEES